MLRFALARILMAVPTLLIVAASVFVLIRLVPGDPASLMLGDLADAASLADLRARLGLDRSLPEQFVIWFGNALTGDLGRSITTGQAVAGLVLERFWVSARIVVAAVLFASLVAVPAGMIAAWRQNGVLDLTLVGLSTLLLSIPTFWLGLLLLLLFGLKLGWLPVVGYVSFSEDPWAALLYMAMPIATLFPARDRRPDPHGAREHARGAAARLHHPCSAKGPRESAVLWRHAFKNAFGPTWTLIGLVLGNLLGGIAIVETVFTIPGLGRLLVDAIFGRDYPVSRAACCSWPSSMCW
jgi:peptide/nickel transport system permease protein